MLSGDRAYLCAVIQELHNGTTVYQRILQNYSSGQAHEVLDRVIKARMFASQFLQRLINKSQQTALPTAHAFGSVLHKMYPDMLQLLPEDFSHDELCLLIKVEEASLTVMQEAYEKLADDLLKAVLRDLNPRLNGKPSLKLEQAS